MDDRIEFEGEGFRAWCYTAIPAEPGTGDWADIHVETPRGKFVATFYTLQEIQRDMDEARRDGLAYPGNYFTDRSMVIVRTLDLPTIREAIDGLVRHGEIYRVFEPSRSLEDDSDLSDPPSI